MRHGATLDFDIVPEFAAMPATVIIPKETDPFDVEEMWICHSMPGETIVEFVQRSFAMLDEMVAAIRPCS